MRGSFDSFHVTSFDRFGRIGYGGNLLIRLHGLKKSDAQGVCSDGSDGSAVRPMLRRTRQIHKARQARVRRAAALRSSEQRRATPSSDTLSERQAASM